MRYEYYCKYCDLPQEISKTIDRVKDTEWCKLCQLPLERRFSIPVIHMQKAAGKYKGEEYAITDEPPDYAKPENQPAEFLKDQDTYKIVSTATQTKRRKNVTA